MVRKFNMTDKNKMSKNRQIFFQIPGGEIKDIYSTVEERTVKPKVHTITKI